MPPSKFLCEALEFIGVELIHLNANSILSLAMCAHICEAFLAVRPDINVFFHFFHVVQNRLPTIVS